MSQFWIPNKLIPQASIKICRFSFNLEVLGPRGVVFCSRPYEFFIKIFVYTLLGAVDKLNWRQAFSPMCLATHPPLHTVALRPKFR